MRRGYEIAAFAFLAAYAALHVIFGLAVPTERLWGADILRFCRGWQLGVFLCLVGGSLCLAWPAFAARVEAGVAWLGSRLGARGSRLLVTHAVLFVASAAALFLLGTKYSGGDASWMWEAGKLPLFLKRSPLSSAPLVLGTWAGEAVGAAYLPSLQATITLVGALSVCGLFQLFLTLFGDRARAWAFLAVALSSYGLSRLLPGYIEVYGVTLLFLVVFECALVSYCLRGRGLVVLLAALGAFVLAHIQALVVVPGVFVLGLVMERRRKRLRRFVALWALLALVLAGLYPLLRHRGQSFGLASALERAVARGRALRPDARRPARQDDALGPQRANLLERHVARLEAAVDVVLPHPPRDELAVLGAEVQDKDRVVGHTGFPIPDCQLPISDVPSPPPTSCRWSGD